MNGLKKKVVVILGGVGLALTGVVFSMKDLSAQEEPKKIYHLFVTSQQDQYTLLNMITVTKDTTKGKVVAKGKAGERFHFAELAGNSLVVLQRSPERGRYWESKTLEVWDIAKGERKARLEESGDILQVTKEAIVFYRAYPVPKAVLDMPPGLKRLQASNEHKGKVQKEGKELRRLSLETLKVELFGEARISVVLNEMERGSYTPLKLPRDRLHAIMVKNGKGFVGIMDLKTGKVKKICDIDQTRKYRATQISANKKYIGLQYGKEFDRFNLDIVDVANGTLKTIASNELYLPGRNCSKGQYDQFDFLDDDRLVYQRSVWPRKRGDSHKDQYKVAYHELVVYEIKTGNSKVIHKTEPGELGYATTLEKHHPTGKVIWLGTQQGNYQIDSKTLKLKETEFLPLQGTASFFREHPGDKVWYLKGDTRKVIGRLSHWGNLVSINGKAIAFVTNTRDIWVYIDSAEKPVKVFKGADKTTWLFICWSEN